MRYANFNNIIEEKYMSVIVSTLPITLVYLYVVSLLFSQFISFLVSKQLTKRRQQVHQKLKSQFADHNNL